MNFLLFASELYAIEIMAPLEAVIKKAGHTVAWFFSKPVEQKLLENKSVLTDVDQVKNFNPSAVFVPGNWVPDFFPGIKVQIFHGFGIEKKGHFHIRGFFDLYCTHGELTTVPFKQLAKQHGYFQVVETGWPKVDPLFMTNASSVDMKYPTILYAPTFSPSLTSAPDLFDEIKRISNLGKYNWIVKFHPKMDVKTMNQYRAIESKFFTVSTDQEILPLLQSTDLMITDTSSVVYEYILLKKPVITYRNKKPGPHIVDFSEASQLEKVLYDSFEKKDEIVKNAREVANKMHPYIDGKSSDRVLQATLDFIKDSDNGLKNKPLNLLRKWRARKNLKYYHFK